MTDGQFRRFYKLTPSRHTKAKGPPARPIPRSYFDKITKEKRARRATEEVIRLDAVDLGMA